MADVLKVKGREDWYWECIDCGQVSMRHPEVAMAERSAQRHADLHCEARPQ